MKKIKPLYIITFILCLILTGAVGFTIYSLYLLKGIETFYRIMVIIILLLFTILFDYSIIDSAKRQKKKKFITFTILSILMSIICGIVAYLILTVYSKLNDFSTDEVKYHTSLISLKDLGNKIDKIKDIKIGMISDEEDIEGYILPNELITQYKLKDKNEIKEYSDTITLMTALTNGEIDAIFISSNYQNMFKSIENFDKDTKIYLIHEYGKNYKKSNTEEDIISTGTKITKPFTILLLGIDSEEASIKSSSSFNGDTIMLISFDPETLHATMFSIPRDTYVRMACGGNLTKINAAAWGGTKCMVKTVENFTGLTIDYYAKINFRGVIDLVDVLGGITVDVPMDFCESNEDRMEGPGYEICLNKGVQVLNGKQALALARHRKTLPLGDFQRGQNQQLVVEGMINQAKTIRNVNDLYKILDTISDNIDLSMTTEELLSFYNIAKSLMVKGGDVNLNITKTFLTGYDLTVYESWGYTYTFQNYQQSLDSIIKAMKINLGQIEQEEIKKMNFSINTPYEKEIVGYKYYSEARKTLMPKLIGSTLSYAQSWASSAGRSIQVNEIESSDTNYVDGQIINQSVHDGVIIDKIPSTITVDVIRLKETVKEPEPSKPSDEDTKEDDKNEENNNNNNEENNNNNNNNNTSENEETNE